MSEDTHAGQITSYRYLVAILFLPVLVLWWQDNSLNPPFDSAGSWMYFGYFRNLVEFKRSALSAVEGSHLSWILPAAALHSLFNPDLASRILHLSIHLLATASLFIALKRISGPRQAFLVAMLFCTYPSVWMATGWDLNDGIAIAYCLLTFALLTRAAMAPVRRGALFAAGTACAALFYSNSDWIPLAPLLPLYYLGLTHIRSHVTPVRALLHLCCWMLPGALLLTAAFCAINQSLDGHLFFYDDPVLAALRVNTPPASPWSGLWSRGAPSAWLLFPLAAAVIALLVLIAAGVRRKMTEPVLFSGLFLCALAWMALGQLRGNSTLGAGYHASALLPFAFLLIGALPCEILDRISAGRYLLICWIAALALSYSWQEAAAVLARDLGWAGWLGVAALVAYCWWSRSVERLVCLVAAFCLLSAVVAGQAYGGLTPNAYRHRAETISSARARVEAIRHGRPVRFWFRTLETDDATALSSSYIGATALGDQLPVPPCDAVVLPSSVIVAITTDPSRTSQSLASVLSDCWRSNGLRATPVETDSFPYGDSGYRMTLLQVERIPGARIDFAPEPGGSVTDWKLAPVDATALVQPSAQGLVIHNHPGDSISAVSPAMRAPIAGRYGFSLIYWPGFGEPRFGLVEPAGRKWLASAPKALWNGSNYQLECWVDLQSGQEFQLAIANPAGQTRPAWFLVKQLKAVRVSPITPQ